MTTGKLILQNLRYYWRTHLGVIFGVAISSSILTGALLVGDTVSYSLNRQALSRLGNTQLALVGQDRYFQPSLADQLSDKLQITVAPVLQLNGLLINSETNARQNQVQILGIDQRFWKIGGGNSITIADNEVALNGPLAAQLGIEPGDQVRLRMARPELLSRDAPLSLDSDMSLERRLTVKAIISESDFGGFGLQANQVTPMNAWVPLGWLADNVDLANQANMLLAGDLESNNITSVEADAALNESWQLADVGLELRELKKQKVLELRSSRIFLEEPIIEAAIPSESNPLGVLTYFVNEIRSSDNSTPYSVVAALGNLPPQTNSLLGEIIPQDLAEDEIVINQWLADDLQVQPSDTIELTYYVFGPMRQLIEQSSSFTIRKILPMTAPGMDPELLPDYPGLADAENCRDWQPGIDIEVGQIRPKDEEYWDNYRGTPKAFISLAAGQKLWANRFGNLTAIRYPLAQTTQDQIEQTIKSRLDPAQVGLFFQPVRRHALAAAGQAQNLGMIFLSLSFFIIAAALSLMGLLFVFGVEQRKEEAGTLLSLGFTRRKVRRLYLLEGLLLASIGTTIGIIGGIIYTRLMIYQLSTAWGGAIGKAQIIYHTDGTACLIGALSGLVVAALAMWLTLFWQGRQPIKQLLDGLLESSPSLSKNIKSKPKSTYIAAASIIVAILLIIFLGSGDQQSTMGVFFGAGCLLLTAALAISHRILSQAAITSDNLLKTLGNFALRNAGRRRGRSLAVIGLLACGGFLVFAIGAFQKDPLANADRRDSGTGGFTLIGESTLPVLHDMNQKSGRQEMGLASDDLADLQVVQMRLRQGDDASCLNLNRPQTPRLLGVQPEEFADRQAFEFVAYLDDQNDQNPWLLLNQSQSDGAVPAITDDNTIKWALDKHLGDTLSYTDERGRTFNVRLVGALKNSILQGSLVVSEDALISHYPSLQGYSVFFFDVPPENTEKVKQAFSRLEGSNRDIGLQLTNTTDRLASYYEMESTYLSMFQMLGGLGMLLGIAGLALVVLRNVMERRSELAMLRAVGFDKTSLTQLLLYEHWWLVLLGLGSGVVTAIVAVLPAVRSSGSDFPLASLGIILAAMLISGLVWIWLATQIALRGPLLDALRNE